MAISKEDAQKKVEDILNIRNYLALYLTIFGQIELPDGKTKEDFSKEELKAFPRREIKSGDALKLMGIKIEKM